MGSLQKLSFPILGGQDLLAAEMEENERREKEAEEFETLMDAVDRVIYEQRKWVEEAREKAIEEDMAGKLQ